MLTNGWSINGWSIAFLIFIILASCLVMLLIMTILYYLRREHKIVVPVATGTTVATVESGIELKKNDFDFH